MASSPEAVRLPHPAAVTPEQAVAIITRLYEGHQQQELVAWALAFQSDKRSWQVLPELLGAPAPTVQMFAADSLYKKVRTEWHQLATEHRGVLYQGLLERYTASEARLVPEAQRRLALAVCACSVLMPMGAAKLLQQALSYLSPTRSSSPVAVGMVADLMGSLPEEAESADVPRDLKDEIEAQLRRNAPTVFQLLSWAIADPAGGEGSPVPSPLHVERSLRTLQASGSLDNAVVSGLTSVLSCLQKWVRIAYTASEMASSWPQLTAAAVRCLCLPNRSVIAAASAFVESTVGVQAYPRPAGTDAALAAVANGVVACQAVLRSAAASGDTEVVRALCRAISAIGVFETEWLCGPGTSVVSEDGAPLGLKVIELLLECTALPDRRASELVMEVWIRIQDIPIASRHPSLGGDLFSKLLGILVSQVSYPASYDPSVGWTSVDVSGLFDPEDFMSFRDSPSRPVLEVLLTTHTLLQERFGELLNQLTVGSDLTWQTLEAVVYCFCSVADQVLEDLADGVGGKFLEIIASLIQRITTMPPGSTPGPLLAMSCELIAAYSTLLQSAVASSEAGGTLLNGVLALLTLALQSSDEDVFGAAACGLKAVCSTCGSRMADASVFATLCASYEAAVRKGDIDLQACQTVVDGLTGVIARMAGEAVAPCVASLVGPICSRIEAGMAAATAPGCSDVLTWQERVSTEYSVLATVVRAAGARAKGKSTLFPSAAVLVASLAEPMLRVLGSSSATVAAFGGSSDCMEAVIGLYKDVILHLKDHVGSSLSAMLDVVVGLYATCWYDFCLDTIRAMVESFVTNPAPSREAVLAAPDSLDHNLMKLLTQVTTSTAELAANPSKLADRMETISSYFALAEDFVAYAPASLMASSSVLPFLVRTSGACIQVSDRPVVRSIHKFYVRLGSYLVGAGAAYSSDILGLMLTLGEEVAAGLAAAMVADSSDATSPFLHAMLGCFLRAGPKAAELLSKALEAIARAKHERESPPPPDDWKDGTGKGICALSHAERVEVVTHMLRFVTSNRSGSLKALVVEFAQVCRSQRTKDVLVAYQMIE